jgi:predicted O-linked N-acetylglucosamine transferase (SPINDLY family)
MNTEIEQQVDTLYQQAFTLHQQGRLDEARVAYVRVTQMQPRHAPSFNFLGVIALQTQDPKAAVDLFGRAIDIDPDNAVSHINRGSAYSQLNQHEAAIACYDRAIALETDCDASAYYNRGNALHQLKQYAAAIASYDQALAIGSNLDADAHYSRAAALQALGQLDAAIAGFNEAVALGSAFAAEALFSRGLAQFELCRFEAAIDSFDRAIALDDEYPQAFNSRGATLARLGKFAAAIESYDQALRLEPGYVRALCNRALALACTGDFGGAVAGFDRAIALKPDDADAHANRAISLVELQRFPEALESFDTAIALNSSVRGLHGMRLTLKSQICDWSALDPQLADLVARIERGEPASPPFNFLTLVDSAALQLRVTRNWLQTSQSPAPSPEEPRRLEPGRVEPGLLRDAAVRTRERRIRVGYFSADFHEHATLYLMAGLFEMHDRTRFEILIFSFGPESQGPMRTRLLAACDEFIDIRGLSDPEAIRRARAADLDIAVDLKGFTHHARPGIFAARVAPLQVGYLGYPGTVGGAMDYLIADRVLIPDGAERHYAEKIIYLPQSYQVNDDKRAPAQRIFTREELGLPAAGIVFCAFNTAHKIKPAMFDVWMSILRRVEGSVLWLFAEHAEARENLSREAARRGMAVGRLIFAGRVDWPEHLARQRASDLFLDTLPYNAHTTASEALWMGLPVLTCAGDGFAARVAASLLTAVQLPQLIARDLAHYEELAVELATDRSRLSDIKRALLDSIPTAPLFDTRRTTADIESGYAQIQARHEARLPPAPIHISP